MNIQFRLIGIALLFFLHCRTFSAQQAVAKEKQAQEKEKYAVTAPLAAINMDMHATSNKELRQFFKQLFKSTDFKPTKMFNDQKALELLWEYLGKQWRPYKTLSTEKSDQWTEGGIELYGGWPAAQPRFADKGNRVVLELRGRTPHGHGHTITWDVSTGACVWDSQLDVWNKKEIYHDGQIDRLPAAYIREDGVIRGQHLTRYYASPDKPVELVRHHQVQLDVDQTALLKKIIKAPEQPAAPASAVAAHASPTTTVSTLKRIICWCRTCSDCCRE